MNVLSWLKTAQTHKHISHHSRICPESSETAISRLDAEIILAHVLKINRTHLHAHPDQALTKTELKIANNLLKRRQNHEPVAYLIGHKEFYGRPFKVTSATLIPRPETEDIIILAKQIANNPTIQPRHILDLGTGSGCIAITLSIEFPAAQVTATDISQKALNIAKQNAKTLNTPNITFLKSNLFNNKKLKSQKFDIICANLPYVDETWTWNSSDLKHEPKAALYANNQGLAIIQKFLDQVPYYSTKNTHILIEADQSQHTKIITYAKKYHLKLISTANLILHFQSA